MIHENSRLEELLKLKEEIEAEIEEIENENVIDEALEDLTESLIDEIDEADENICFHCLIKEYLRMAYDVGYEDAILNIEEN